MTNHELAVKFAERYDPYEMHDEGITFEELVEETERLLVSDPETVYRYFEE